MEITITKAGEEIKKFNISEGKLVRGIAKIGVFSFVGKEINRVRPPKRNAGLVLNYITAATITSAVMELVFGKKKEEKAEEEVKKAEPVDVVNNTIYMENAEKESDTTLTATPVIKPVEINFSEEVPTYEG